MKTLALLFTLAASALAQEAPGWGPLTFGMSTAQVRAAFPKAVLEKDGVLRLRKFNVRTGQTDGSAPWTLNLVCKTGTLEKVSLSASDVKTAPVETEFEAADVRKLLVEKYGAPIHKETTRNALGSGRREAWKTKRALITLHDDAGFRVVYVIFDPPGQAKGL